MIGRPRPEPPVEILERMKHPVLADTRPDAGKGRDAAISAMTRALRAEGRRRRRRFAWPLVSAAAVLALVGAAGYWKFHGPHAGDGRTASAGPMAAADAGPVELRVASGVVVATRHGVDTVVSGASLLRITEGDAVRTGPDAHASLLLPRGVRVELARATKASVVVAGEVEQKLALDIGETFVSVPKPGGPSTFSVTTPDARVVVHGTEFTVRVDGDSASSARTSVSVTRGSVSVVNAAGERLLYPGESWTAADSRPAAKADAPPPDPAALAHARVGQVKESPSSLAEQNKLFQAALDARRAGDDAAVLRSIDELFARYPDTTLAEEARLARFRALKSLHKNQEAAREAKRYLSAHPDAPAADEARRALLESTTGEP